MSSLHKLIAVLVFAALACQPNIGDSCTNASDCSVQDQRTCDTTFPGGYCTVFGCGADTCPSESACIGFQSLVSVAAECAEVGVRPRLQRTACMFSCSRDSDCRGGYVCVDLTQGNPWGALVIDRGGRGKVCTLAPPPAAVGDTAVCSHAPPPEFPAYDAGGADVGPTN